MRGTHVTGAGTSYISGIIPAYAGNTGFSNGAFCAITDHPRVCGEHNWFEDYHDVVKGSSPRMRGTLLQRVVLTDIKGIIPAYAGNTDDIIIPVRAIRDHPRVCGEHKITAGGASMEAGSSPRMRGTPFSGSLLIAWLGIIPAYAGNTSVLRAVSRSRRDHPRVCGEHTGGSQRMMHNPGSSPRMRGTRDTSLVQEGESGIIPAYAGNTGSMACTVGIKVDHPRVCGEHLEPSPVQNSTAGSSPRMRGTH